MEESTQEFSLIRPIDYSLNRAANTHQYTSKWVMRTSSLNIANASIYALYLSTTAYMGLYSTVFTGEEDVYQVLPFGEEFAIGNNMDISKTVSDIVNISADKLIAQNLEIYIT